jgi:hypothetical protein
MGGFFVYTPWFCFVCVRLCGFEVVLYSVILVFLGLRLGLCMVSPNRLKDTAARKVGSMALEFYQKPNP